MEWHLINCFRSANLCACVCVCVSNIQKVAIQNTVAKQFLKNEEKKLFVNFYFKQ